MALYANQKTVLIRKKSYKDSFLQIGISEWQEACKVLKPSAFKLYLYLASNKDGFRLGLSREAVFNAIGVTKSPYYEAQKELMEHGYLVETGAGFLEFHTSPAPKNGNYINSFNQEGPSEGKQGLETGKQELNPGKSFPPKSKVIDNIDNNKEKTNKGPYPKARWKLSDVTDDEEDMQSKYRALGF